MMRLALASLFSLAACNGVDLGAPHEQSGPGSTSAADTASPDASGPSSDGSAPAAVVAKYAKATQLGSGLFTQLANDGTNVYALFDALPSSVAYGAGTFDVVAIPVDGKAITNVATGQVSAVNLMANSGNAAWFAQVTAPAQSTATSTSLVDATSKGSAELATQLGAGVQLAFGATPGLSGAIGGKKIFWSVQGVAELYAVPIAGGATSSVAVPTAPNSDPALDGLWSISVIGGNSTDIFWYDTGGIEKMPLAGGAQTTVLTGTHELLAVDGSTLYYADTRTVAGDNIIAEKPADIYSVSTSGGKSTLIASTVYDLHSFTFDDDSLYWIEGAAENSESELMRLQKSSGKKTAIVSVQGASQGDDALLSVTATGGNVYWSDASQSTLMALTL